MLLPRARRLLSLHDETVRELRGGETTLLVNVIASGLTPALIAAGTSTVAPRPAHPGGAKMTETARLIGAGQRPHTPGRSTSRSGADKEPMVTVRRPSRRGVITTPRPGM